MLTTLLKMLKEAPAATRAAPWLISSAHAVGRHWHYGHLLRTLQEALHIARVLMGLYRLPAHVPAPAAQPEHQHGAAAEHVAAPHHG